MQTRRKDVLGYTGSVRYLPDLIIWGFTLQRKKVFTKEESQKTTAKKNLAPKGVRWAHGET
jgi:hypothetical protein